MGRTSVDRRSGVSGRLCKDDGWSLSGLEDLRSESTEFLDFFTKTLPLLDSDFKVVFPAFCSLFLSFCGESIFTIFGVCDSISADFLVESPENAFRDVSCDEL